MKIYERAAFTTPNFGTFPDASPAGDAAGAQPTAHRPELPDAAQPSVMPAFHSIFPLENEELRRGSWQAWVVVDPDEPAPPAPLMLDLNDTAMLLDATIDTPVFKRKEPKFPQVSRYIGLFILFPQSETQIECVRYIEGIYIYIRSKRLRRWASAMVSNGVIASPKYM